MNMENTTVGYGDSMAQVVHGAELVSALDSFCGTAINENSLGGRLAEAMPNRWLKVAMC